MMIAKTPALDPVKSSLMLPIFLSPLSYFTLWATQKYNSNWFFFISYLLNRYRPIVLIIFSILCFLWQFSKLSLPWFHCYFYSTHHYYSFASESECRRIHGEEEDIRPWTRSWTVGVSWICCSREIYRNKRRKEKEG